MCTSVEYDNMEIMGIGELKNAGFIVLPEDSDMEPEADWSDNSCLCCIDVEAVLNRSGLHWTESDWGYTVHGTMKDNAPQCKRPEDLWWEVFSEAD